MLGLLASRCMVRTVYEVGASDLQSKVGAHISDSSFFCRRLLASSISASSSSYMHKSSLNA